jgi:hypothetical protein
VYTLTTCSLKTLLNSLALTWAGQHGGERQVQAPASKGTSRLVKGLSHTAPNVFWGGLSTHTHTRGVSHVTHTSAALCISRRHGQHTPAHAHASTPH